MNLGMLDLHGRVRAFSDGKLLWDRPNKITTLGRKALLAAMARKDEIEQTDSDTWFHGCGSNWRFNPESWISCYAFGNGGALTTENAVIPAATSMADLNMYHIVPLRLKGDYNQQYDLSEYVDLPLTKRKDPDHGLDPGRSSEDKDYTLSRLTTTSVDDLDPNNCVYFKRLESVDMGVKEIHTTSTSLIDASASRIGVHSLETAVATFKLKISEKDLQRVFPEDATDAQKEAIVSNSKINELSLYIAAIEKEENVYAPYKFKKITEGSTSWNTLPIQFSHITFPTENFFGNSTKDIDLEYYVFA